MAECGLQSRASEDRACSGGVPLLPYWTAVWGVWRLGAHFGLFVTVVELAVSSFCGVAGRIVLPGEAAAVGSVVAMGGCALE